MPVRVALLGVGHVHAPSYIRCLGSTEGVELVGYWDEKAQTDLAKRWDDRAALLAACDAVVVAGENMDHADAIEAAAAAGKSVLCEKPLAATQEQAERIERCVRESGVLLMTAFPCPYSPAFEGAKAKVESGEIGKVLSVCATNHGKCPGGWFTDPARSGGGALIDHTVHVADLLRRLLGEDPSRIHAVTGTNMQGQGWEDTAMLTIEFPSGAFASLDASWSRPSSYKTWGDVTLKIVGEKGVIELDLFVQSLDLYSDRTGSHGSLGYGSNLDAAMVADFLRAHSSGKPPRATMRDGLAASGVAFAAYESARTGQPVAV
jgi:predicted dehydrogenase